MIWLISGIIIITLTEVIYYLVLSEDVIDLYDMVTAKIKSITSAFVIWIFLIGFPYVIEGILNCSFTNKCIHNYLPIFGWYYGIIVGIIIFFILNWIITNYLNKKKSLKKEEIKE